MIRTIRDYRKAVREASEIRAQVRFGCSEKWVKITKADALALVANVSIRAKPEDLEMYSGDFGMVDGSTFYIG